MSSLGRLGLLARFSSNSLRNSPADALSDHRTSKTRGTLRSHCDARTRERDDQIP